MPPVDAVEIAPIMRPPDVVVRVPGSKSLTNRALLLAALASGESTLEHALFSDDTRYMVGALQRLGLDLAIDEPAERIRVAGAGGRWPVAEAELFVGNAGTAMRFLVAALCLGHGKYRIDGTERMRQRPVGDLVDALRQLGARVTCAANGGPPVGIEARGLQGGLAVLSGERSSQFLSAVLQAAPYAARDVVVTLPGPLVAQPYVDMTIGLMATFGVTVEREGYREFRVPAGQAYGARVHTIEPDASSAHYFLAAAALTGGRVRIQGLGRGSLQGDVRFADVLAAMGATVAWSDDGVEVRGPAQLDGIDIDLNALSDTAPTLAVLGAFARAPVHIRNIAHVRWQESDRLAAVATELRGLGVSVDELPDGLVVRPSALRPGLVRTYDDHRIAMSFALAGLRTPGIRIADPGCVGKTFPDYFARLETLRP